MSYEVIEQNKEHMTRWKGFVLSILRQSRVVGITGQLARVASSSLQLIVVFVLVVSGFTGLIVTAVPGIAAAANSSPTWAIQKSYLAPASGLSSVSCPTSSDCFAVGENTVGGPALYETTDGGSIWANDTLSLPSGEYSLGGVSCVSATFCEAVGGNSALSWNGTTWTNQTLPSSVSDPSGVFNPSGVSCVSATFCEAVGYGLTSSGIDGVALSWNGSTWTNQTLPSNVGVLYGVSCISANSCEAVGYNSPSNNNGVALSWNGSTLDKCPAGDIRDTPVASALPVSSETGHASAG